MSSFPEGQDQLEANSVTWFMYLKELQHDYPCWVPNGISFFQQLYTINFFVKVC